MNADERGSEKESAFIRVNLRLNIMQEVQAAHPEV